MTLVVETPVGYGPERHYILSVLLGEFLGLEWVLRLTDRRDVRIGVEGLTGELRMPEGLFATPPSDWLSADSLPEEPLRYMESRSFLGEAKVLGGSIPVIYGDDSDVELRDGVVHLPLDIFGSAFFLLTRYEEAVVALRDEHGRFPASASLAYRAGFLNRALVNEYLEVLWVAMKRLWPRIQRRTREFRVIVSCDVDLPYSPGIKNGRAAIRQVAGDVLKRRSLQLAVRSVANTLASRVGYYGFEPFDTFEWIMDVNESAGNRVAFYVMSGFSPTPLDGVYDLNEPRIRSLLRRIHDRGHEIGLHSSYESYQDAKRTRLEASRLREALANLGLPHDELGNRQHYLRWEDPTTARNLVAAGLAYDTTLGFADHPGFRCGTCYEYPLYDLWERRCMNVRERPLVVMEASVLDRRYMNLGYTTDALDMMLMLKHRCELYNGQFTLLWHNSHFTQRRDRELYRMLLT